MSHRKKQKINCFANLKKLHIHCRSTHLVSADLIEFISLCPPKYNISFKIEVRSMILFLQNISHMLIQIVEKNWNCFGFVNHGEKVNIS